MNSGSPVRLLLGGLPVVIIHLPAFTAGIDPLDPENGSQSFPVGKGPPVHHDPAPGGGVVHEPVHVVIKGKGLVFSMDQQGGVELIVDRDGAICIEFHHPVGAAIQVQEELLTALRLFQFHIDLPGDAFEAVHNRSGAGVQLDPLNPGAGHESESG